MKWQEKPLAIFGFLIITAALSYVAVLHNHKVGSESSVSLPDQQYVNTVYGFSFGYAPHYSLNEYTSRNVEILDQVTGAALAEVSVEIAEDSAYESFDDFAHARAELICGGVGDTPGSVRCPSVSRSEPFVGESGEVGEVFYLTYELSLDGATSTRESGPYYAFNISDSVPKGEYAALLVYPAHAAEESALYDAGAAASLNIVHSLKLTKRGSS